MRYLLGFLCVCALGVVPLIGCSETAGECEGAANGAACSDGACLDGACTALTTASGTVLLYEGLDPDLPAVGATVSVHGT